MTSGGPSARRGLADDRTRPHALLRALHCERERGNPAGSRLPGSRRTLRTFSPVQPGTHHSRNASNNNDTGPVAAECGLIDSMMPRVYRPPNPPTPLHLSLCTSPSNGSTCPPSRHPCPSLGPSSAQGRARLSPHIRRFPSSPPRLVAGASSGGKEGDIWFLGRRSVTSPLRRRASHSGNVREAGRRGDPSRRSLHHRAAKTV